MPCIYKKTIFYLWLAAFTVIPGLGFSQIHPDDGTIALRFDAIDNDKGIPEYRSYAIVEDHLGLLWLGTPQGLIKYDGYDFQVYHYGYHDSSLVHLQSDQMKVQFLTEGANGDLWIGMEPWPPRKPALVRFDRETERFIPYLFDPTDNQPPIQNWVSSIQADSHYIWVSILQKESLIRIKPEREYKEAASAYCAPYEIIDTSFGILPDESINYVLKDQKERLWLAGEKGLYIWEQEKDKFRYIESEEMVNTTNKNCRCTSIVEDEDSNFWISTLSCGGILAFDTEKEQFEFHDLKMSFGILPDIHDKIWLGRSNGAGGLFWYNSETKRITKIDVRPEGTDFFPVLRVLDLFQDSYGMTWIGSMEGPLLKFNPQQAAFRWEKAEPSNPNSLSHNWVLDIDQDKDGNYWIATFGGGLNRWNRNTDTFTYFGASSESEINIGTDLILNLSIDHQGRIWYGFPLIGCLDLTTKDLQIYTEGSGTINSITTDSKGRIWVGRYRSLDEYIPETNSFKSNFFPHPDNPKVLIPVDNIWEDSHGMLWVSLLSDRVGFCRFDPSDDTYQFFKSTEALSFCEDQKGFIWVGTQTGLLQMDQVGNMVQRFDTNDGLPQSSVHSILEDHKGILWLTTSSGLSRFNSNEKVFRNYFESDGLPTSQFTRACFKNEQGELFFGTRDGMVYFHPDSIRDHPIPPKLVWTQLDLFGKPLPVGKNSPLEKHISVTEAISLQHWQNDLTIHYAGLHYKNPEKNQYQVKLENYDQEWRRVGTQRIANYTNLDPGQYTFRVKAANSDGIWNEDGIALDITIHPPWYWNTFSQIIYLILVLGLIIGIYQFQLRRRLALAEADRLKKLDAFKSRLFTNITHEFRTPLTVIKGMSKQLERYEKKEFKAIIQRNANQLLRLVNQLLDLAKLSSGNMPINVNQGDMVLYLKYLTESFHSYAFSKKINLSFSANPESILMDFDKDKIQQIVSNLLANAIKFTPEGGEVDLLVFKTPRVLEIKIKDTGPGIPAEKLPYIFDRFFQGDDSDARIGEGTGIGLALVKELVELLGGAINVESKWKKGSTFTVLLPIQNRAPLQKDVLPEVDWIANQPMLTKVAELEALGGNKPLVLIIEDNKDIIQYLCQLLRSDYKLQVAKNGEEGIKKALEIVPDIIISDVMMPKKDGYEVCRFLKKDERTSHISIVLLTAKGDQASRVTGLECGADAFLSKPFDEQELFVRLEKLLTLRNVLQAKYQQIELGTFGEQENYTDPELAFLHRLEQTILEHLSEEDFRVDPNLCRAMQMSRPQLYRKIKALKDISPSEYLRQLRLKKARQLLQNSNLTIAEIAEKVGFGDPSYFTKVYSAEFGELPSKTRKT